MIEVDVEVEAEAWLVVLPDAEFSAIAAAQRALGMAQKSGGVTVLLADNAEVRALNARFRGKDTATNVLSFPSPANPEDHLGDVALAFEICQREAAEQGKPLSDHLQHLVAHGVLHLIGYDHEDDGEAQVMEDLERHILESLGVADPYA